MQTADAGHRVRNLLSRSDRVAALAEEGLRGLGQKHKHPDSIGAHGRFQCLDQCRSGAPLPVPIRNDERPQQASSPESLHSNRTGDARRITGNPETDVRGPEVVDREPCFSQEFSNPMQVRFCGALDVHQAQQPASLVRVELGTQQAPSLAADTGSQQPVALVISVSLPYTGIVPRV